jgi:hypothetical protein
MDLPTFTVTRRHMYGQDVYDIDCTTCIESGAQLARWTEFLEIVPARITDHELHVHRPISDLPLFASATV